jgi:F0F1-type ATP synthase membrane subunit b/b'
MIWNVFSFFLTNEEPFLEFNTNILETNAINLALLVGLLIYGNKISIQPGLQKRQEDIIQTIENAQKDVVNASNFYSVAEQGYAQSIFWFQSWKALYQKEKLEIVNIKYKLVKKGFLDTFTTTENIIKSSEKKSFLSLQKYILYVTASRVLRRFILLSENEQSKILETTISRLGGAKK